MVEDFKDCHVYVIDNDKETLNGFHKHGWGGEQVEITKEQIQELMNGKCLAWCDGEYTHVVKIKEGD